MKGQPVIRGHFLRIMSGLPHVNEPVIQGHFIWNIKVSLEDGFHCKYLLCQLSK